MIDNNFAPKISVVNDKVEEKVEEETETPKIEENN